MQKITTQEVLKTVAVSGIILGTGILGPSLPMVLAGAVKIWKEINRRDLGRIIKRLEKQEMITIKEKDGKTLIEITEKGKRRLLEYDFQNIELKAKRRDGKWRLILFDIPEDKKANRNVFREKLEQIGCVRLQDSVFVSAFPCKDEVDFLCHFLEIPDCVTVVTLDKIERGEQLIFKKHKDWDNEML